MDEKGTCPEIQGRISMFNRNRGFNMKKGTEIIGTVTRMDYPNKGIIETEDGIVKAACALPGQKVRVFVKKVRHGVGEGILKEVVEPSSVETEDHCPHAGRCGGCLYQTYPYEEELKIKDGQVRRLIEPVLAGQDCDHTFEDIVPCTVSEGYRNKMEFTFGDKYKGGPLALGMHRRGSMYDIETVTSCRIVDPDYCRIIEATIRYFAGRNIPYYHRVTHEGYLRHLLVRRTRSGEILVGLVTTGTDGKVRIQDKEEASDTGVNMDVDENELIKGYTDSILGLKNDGTISGSIQGIIHIINDSVADAVKADRVDVLYGQDFITEELLGLKFKITPFSFFQTNTYGAELLYSKVREYAASVMGDGDETIYDLYSGTGTIAQILAGSDYFGNDDEKEGSYKGKDLTDENRQHKRKVIGVEIVEEAVEAARVNAKENGLDNCTFIAGDVLKVLDDLTEKPDLIILDPPREGIHPKALPKIISYGVDNIIYVSCKTTSLARDLEVFLQAGYVVRRICPVDQFPRTGNIETVVLLNNKFAKAKDFVEIEIDTEDYYRIKDSGRTME